MMDGVPLDLHSTWLIVVSERLARSGSLMMAVHALIVAPQSAGTNPEPGFGILCEAVAFVRAGLSYS